VPLSYPATRLEFAGGITAKFGPRLSLFAEGGYQSAVDESGPISGPIPPDPMIPLATKLGDLCAPSPWHAEPTALPISTQIARCLESMTIV
jgi:hypothetical protein